MGPQPIRVGFTAVALFDFTDLVPERVSCEGSVEFLVFLCGNSSCSACDEDPREIYMLMHD